MFSILFRVIRLAVASWLNNEEFARSWMGSDEPKTYILHTQSSFLKFTYHVEAIFLKGCAKDDGVGIGAL